MKEKNKLPKKRLMLRYQKQYLRKRHNITLKNARLLMWKLKIVRIKKNKIFKNSSKR